MTTRKIAPRPGMAGRVHSFYPYATPDDWPDGLPITVISMDTHGKVRIRDGEREITLPHWNVDCGWMYEVAPRTWLPESHPRVLAEMKRSLAKFHAELDTLPICLRRDRESVISDTEATLRRYGALPV